jgi:hypothetical protein
MLWLVHAIGRPTGDVAHGGSLMYETKAEGESIYDSIR